MYRAVVDTNLIVSGIASTTTPPYFLLEAWRQGKYVLVTSPGIIGEIVEVMSRPVLQQQLHITDQDRDDLVDLLTNQAFVTAGVLSVDVVKNDPDDNVIIACAMEGFATHIVTGDRDLLSIGEYQGVQIVTAREFLAKLGIRR